MKRTRRMCATQARALRELAEHVRQGADTVPLADGHTGVVQYLDTVHQCVKNIRSAVGGRGVQFDQSSPGSDGKKAERQRADVMSSRKQHLSDCRGLSGSYLVSSQPCACRHGMLGRQSEFCVVPAMCRVSASLWRTWGAVGAIPDQTPRTDRVQKLCTSVLSDSMCVFQWGRLGHGLAVWF